MTVTALNSGNLPQSTIGCVDVAGRPRTLLVRHTGAELTFTSPPGEAAQLTRAAVADLRDALEAFLGRRHAVKPAPQAPPPSPALRGGRVWRLPCRDGLGRADRGFAVTEQDDGFVLFTTPAGQSACLDVEQAGPLWTVLGLVVDGKTVRPRVVVADQGSALRPVRAEDSGEGTTHA